MYNITIKQTMNVQNIDINSQLISTIVATKHNFWKAEVKAHS